MSSDINGVTVRPAVAAYWKSFQRLQKTWDEAFKHPISSERVYPPLLSYYKNVDYLCRMCHMNMRREEKARSNKIDGKGVPCSSSSKRRELPLPPRLPLRFSLHLDQLPCPPELKPYLLSPKSEEMFQSNGIRIAKISEDVLFFCFRVESNVFVHCRCLSCFF